MAIPFPSHSWLHWPHPKSADLHAPGETLQRSLGNRSQECWVRRPRQPPDRIRLAIQRENRLGLDRPKPLLIVRRVVDPNGRQVRLPRKAAQDQTIGQNDLTGILRSLDAGPVRRRIQKQSVGGKEEVAWETGNAPT